MTYHPSQGRVSKRYNRRVRYAYVTRRLKLRIAELEAELTACAERGLATAARAEKAESEVERLSLSSGKASGKTSDAQKVLLRMRELWEVPLKRRIAELEAEVERLTADLETALKIIKDGGRESGSRASAPEPDSECGADRRTAANPAAPSLSARKATPRTRLYNQATDRWEEVG